MKRQKYAVIVVAEGVAFVVGLRGLRLWGYADEQQSGHGCRWQ